MVKEVWKVSTKVLVSWSLKFEKVEARWRFHNDIRAHIRVQILLDTSLSGALRCCGGRQVFLPQALNQPKSIFWISELGLLSQELRIWLKILSRVSGTEGLTRILFRTLARGMHRYSRKTRPVLLEAILQSIVQWVSSPNQFTFTADA